MGVVVGAGCACLTATDESLYGAHLRRVDVGRTLLCEEVLDVSIHLLYHLVLVVAEQLVISVDEVHEACHLLVAHSDVARGLVCHVHVMVLLNEAADGATHRDDVVIGMRREHYHALLCRHGTFRAIGVISVGLAAGPSCDGVLQVVEYLDVAVVCRTETGKQV